ncbi:hypothetical protein AB6805_24570 [Chitinophaga sp. RCC_12]|uniref:hypothetical protein n=1 Tax=Chitinophaga sp. RCC_12 TaxID=3239226 RepID=UPI0035265B22
MKLIQLPGLLLACLLTLCSFHSRAQVRGTFVVNGDIDKYYPVVFTDSAWGYNEASELQIGRSSVHQDGTNSWKGSIIATFRYHTNNWGNGSTFIEADIRQYTNPAVPYNKFVAGWKDATSVNISRIIIIWLRGSTSYNYSSRYNDKVSVYDGTASGPLPYTEPLSSVSHTFKTAIDSYVNTNGSTYTGNTYSLGGTNYYSGNVGIGTPIPTAKLEIAGAAPWTASSWGKAIKLRTAQSIELEAGIRKFGIGATSDSLLYFFSTDTDTTALPVRYNLVMTNSGNIGIGTLTPNNYKLAVEGTLGARRIKVTQQANWADFVFHPEYKLPSLHEVETFITKNGHLPEIPTAADVKENGVDVGEMNKLLLQKVEELTLYLIQQQKEIDELKRKIK